MHTFCITISNSSHAMLEQDLDIHILDLIIFILCLKSMKHAYAKNKYKICVIDDRSAFSIFSYSSQICKC